MNDEERLYQFSFHSVIAGRYTQAVDGFRMLVLLRPENPFYWLALSEACFRAQEKTQGENAYRIGCSLLIDSPHERKQELEKIAENINTSFRM